LDTVTTVRLGSLTLANPVMPASGCFGPQLAALLPMERLGAVVTKTVFAAARSGNPAHRIAEAPAAVLNSVGIPSPGLDRFRSTVLPQYLALGPPVVVSVGGLAPGAYGEVVRGLLDTDFAAVEINVSCPNLERDGKVIGSEPAVVEQITADAVRLCGDRPVIVKLTPNVTSVAELALAAEAAGAAAVTVANTFLGMSLDPVTRKPLLGNVFGGMSGPAVKPLVLRMVWETAEAVSVPVIACGGIRTTSDALDYLAAGATALQVGTATFGRPTAMTDIAGALAAPRPADGCAPPAGRRGDRAADTGPHHAGRATRAMGVDVTEE
jgi:dihydroorotate dehydrogenase (NAD+) catalytic subunit